MMSEGEQVKPGTEEWRFETGDWIESSPAVEGGTVYVGCDDGNLYAINTNSGEEQWRFETDHKIRSSPAVEDGTVYVGSDDNHLYAIDIIGGKERWRFDTGFRVRSLTVLDGTVYFTRSDGPLCAVAAGSGDERWQLKNALYMELVPSVVDGTVYAGSYSGLHAITADSGFEDWRFETEGLPTSSLTAADGTVYVGTRDNKLYAADALSGEEEWRFETDGRVVPAPTVADGTVYVGCDDGNLYAINTNSGDEQWRFETGDRIRSSPAVDDGTLYVGSRDGHLYAIDQSNGKERWRFDVGLGVYSSPAVVNGTVYFSGGYSNLHAVAAECTTAEDTARQESPPSETTLGGETNGVPRGRTPVVEAPSKQVPAVDAATSPPRRPGLSAEALTIVEELDAGGQAIINKAQLPTDQRPPEMVALREPDTSATLTRDSVEEFLSQAETWVTIDAREREKPRWADYEHIVGVIATGDRQPWLAMEYMDNGDLGELLGKHPEGLPVRQALWYGECVCKGLEIAHNLGRAHLDVKPGNVLLKETDGWPWPKLADWGLARNLAKETGMMEGLSVQYAAPEQFDSSQSGDPDQLTDIYQTGALVYALLTGAPPATGSQFEVMQQVMGKESITAPSRRRPELPTAVDATVGLALERERTERYNSISAFRQALRAVRLGEQLPRKVAARLNE